LKEKPLSTQVYEIITFCRGLLAIAIQKHSGILSATRQLSVPVLSSVTKTTVNAAQMTDLRRR
jgi:hypothetical protein